MWHSCREQKKCSLNRNLITDSQVPLPPLRSSRDETNSIKVEDIHLHTGKCRTITSLDTLASDRGRRRDCACTNAITNDFQLPTYLFGGAQISSQITFWTLEVQSANADRNTIVRDGSSTHTLLERDWMTFTQIDYTAQLRRRHVTNNFSSISRTQDLLTTFCNLKINDGFTKRIFFKNTSSSVGYGR